VRTGNRPWRDNNPGDITMSPKDKSPFATRHGAIGSEGGFAIFPNAQTGFSALSALLSTDSYQSRSILDTMNRFAPASDNNNPTAYAATLGQAVGAPVSTKLSSLSPQQMGALIDKIAHVEGFYHAGTIRMIPAP
jgi:hypothetical protein